MTEMAPAVALLFDDTDLVGQLREALQERGARIVHEGGVSSLSRELLQQVGADVLVINLDDGADDALDHLYEVIDDERPRVVFNDAQASRTLAGWDRARWARHLAVKVLAAGDIDPPRPDGSRLVDTPSTAPAVETSVALAVAQPSESAQGSAAGATLNETPGEAAIVETKPVAEPEVAAAADEDFLSLDDDAAGQDESATTADSENLAAELEALLASGELPDEDDIAEGSGLRFSGDVEPPPLHDGDFGADTAVATSHAVAMDPSGPDVAALLSSSTTPPAFQIDHLELSALEDADVAAEPASVPHPESAASTPAISAPDAWALVEDHVESTPPSGASLDPGMFGIEKMSAADFLAPDADIAIADVEPTMSLELVSMEEAVAPQPYERSPDHEMVLDELGSALSRVVALGAAIDGVDAVCEFLRALPSTTGLTFLLTQHMGDQSDVVLADKFALHSQLPVRLAEQGARAGKGEVLLVPMGQQVRLRRDGSIELQSSGNDSVEGPSIDASLTMAAGVFGRDALAIVFAGRGNDAVAGAQAIHDRGGQVWVESSSGDHFADMVSGIFAERLVSFSGTPNELAARLIEVFP